LDGVKILFGMFVHTNEELIIKKKKNYKNANSSKVGKAICIPYPLYHYPFLQAKLDNKNLKQ